MTEKKPPENPDEDRLNIEDLAPKEDDLKGGRRLRDDGGCSFPGKDNCMATCNQCNAGCVDDQKRGGSKGTLGGGPKGTLHK